MISFPLIPLSELCAINIGRTPSRGEARYWGTGAKWLSIADMNQGRYLARTKEQITEAAAREVMGKPISPGTVALSFKLSIGKVGIISVPMYTNEAIATLPIKKPESLKAEYLYWALHYVNLLEETDDAVMGKTLNKAKLGRVQIPVPSIDEQSRIAETLDQADVLIAKRRQSVALLTDLARSIFLEMFGDAADLYQSVKVGDLAADRKNSIRTGPFGSQLLHGEFTESGIPVLGIDNAVNNEFRWAKRRFISEGKYQKLARYRVFPGDVVITIMGTCGRCAVVPEDIGVAINTKHLCCITLDRSRCLPEFLHSYFLMHPISRSYLQRTAKGAIMSGLNMNIIKAMPVAVPPLDQQERYAAIAREVQEQKLRQLWHLRELEELFNSLQTRAFRGEL
jgi:type I restriction enzyme, S subunit